MELPFFSKFLIIAAYLASYNPARYDRRLFVKAKEGRKNKDKGLKSLKKQKLHNAARLMGPKVFPIDRLMAIFYSIVDERVTPSLNIFVQVWDSLFPCVFNRVIFLFFFSLTKLCNAYSLFNTHADFYFGFLKAPHTHRIGGHVSRSSKIPLQCWLWFSQEFSQVNIPFFFFKFNTNCRATIKSWSGPGFINVKHYGYKNWCILPFWLQDGEFRAWTLPLRHDCLNILNWRQYIIDKKKKKRIISLL